MPRKRWPLFWKAFAGNGALGAPAWLRELREAGMARFADLGFPSPRLEDWRFTNAAPIADTPFVLAHGAPAAAAAAPHLLRGVGLHRLVFVNGRFDAKQSALSGLPDGVTAMSLGEALVRAQVYASPEALKAYGHKKLASRVPRKAGAAAKAGGEAKPAKK